ncbi:MAG: dihydrodipicolinate reductase [Ignisphaera sp.]|nr:dihydrodipicolinate reductase [Ignisphaera sp.]MCX8167797.1 dihydrodipicolinate reductase [Ignisphaera sp.]MDW8086194.1 dihydrodipicolinate reductase [Ignisphaera sp.]
MKIGIYGFGAMGKIIAKAAIERRYEIVAVVDIDSNLVGRDAGLAMGLDEKLGISVSSDTAVLANADIVVHATGSYLDKVFNQIALVVDMGVDIVSTCETLAYPYYRYPVLARKLDDLAKARGVTVLGTGVNPGFLLDTLAMVLAASFNSIRKIRAVRSIDAAKRRESFRKKIGVGENPEVVEDKLRRGVITGHVGYAESTLLIADAAGVQPTKVVEEQSPVVAEHDVESAGVKVLKNMNKGIKGYGSAYIGDKEIIRVEFHAYVAADEYEEIVIEGKDYTVKWRSTGTPGDPATAAVILSLVERIKEQKPGLLTMADLVPFRPRITL